MKDLSIPEPSLTEQMARALGGLDPQFAAFSESLAAERDRRARQALELEKLAQSQQQAEAAERLGRADLAYNYDALLMEQQNSLSERQFKYEEMLEKGRIAELEDRRARARLGYDYTALMQTAAYNQDDLELRRSEHYLNREIDRRKMALEEATGSFERTKYWADMTGVKQQYELQQKMELAGGNPIAKSLLVKQHLGLDMDDLEWLMQDTEVPIERITPLIKERYKGGRQVAENGSSVLVPDTSQARIEYARQLRGLKDQQAEQAVSLGATVAAVVGQQAPAEPGRINITELGPAPERNLTFAADVFHELGYVPPTAGKVLTVSPQGQEALVPAGRDQLVWETAQGVRAPITFQIDKTANEGEPNLYLGGTRVPRAVPPVHEPGQTPTLDDYLSDDYEQRPLLNLYEPGSYTPILIENPFQQDVTVDEYGQTIRGEPYQATDATQWGNYVSMSEARQALIQNTGHLYQLLSEGENYPFSPDEFKGEISSTVTSLLGIWRKIESAGALDQGTIDVFNNFLGTNVLNTATDIAEHLPLLISAWVNKVMDPKTGENVRKQALAQIKNFAFNMEMKARTAIRGNLQGAAESQWAVYENFFPPAAVQNLNDMDRYLKELATNTSRIEREKAAKAGADRTARRGVPGSPEDAALMAEQEVVAPAPIITPEAAEAVAQSVDAGETYRFMAPEDAHQKVTAALSTEENTRLLEQLKNININAQDMHVLTKVMEKLPADATQEEINERLTVALKRARTQALTRKH